jgi:hypothetical protein
LWTTATTTAVATTTVIAATSAVLARNHDSIWCCRRVAFIRYSHWNGHKHD